MYTLHLCLAATPGSLHRRQDSEYAPPDGARPLAPATCSLDTTGRGSRLIYQALDSHSPALSTSSHIRNLALLLCASRHLSVQEEAGARLRGSSTYDLDAAWRSLRFARRFNRCWMKQGELLPGQWMNRCCNQGFSSLAPPDPQRFLSAAGSRVTVVPLFHL